MLKRFVLPHYERKITLDSISRSKIDSEQRRLLKNTPLQTDTERIYSLMCFNIIVFNATFPNELLYFLMSWLLFGRRYVLTSIIRLHNGQQVAHLVSKQHEET